MAMLLEEIKQAVRTCGQIMIQADRTQVGTQVKGGLHNNLVTRYDKEIQQLLRKKLLALVPEAHFVGEEEDIHESITHGPAFIVDPIDGTTNFIKDYKNSVISVAMAVDGVQELGVVYHPYLDELFCAQRGKGAFCNGQRIHATELPLEDGLTMFGVSPYRPDLTDRSFALLRKCYDRSLDIRRSGSAAWDLCCVAAGRAALYFELDVQPWDHAAGSLLVQEAGGIVHTAEGGAVSLTGPCSIVASGSAVDTAFLHI